MSDRMENAEIQLSASHEYTVNGIVRPGVTTVLKAAGLIDDQWYTEASRRRGTAVHAACHYLDEDDLPESWLESSPHAGYVRAWVNFRKETGFRPSLIEHRVFHKKLGYCGTLDRLGSFRSSEPDTVLDIKTGEAQRWHRIQLAAYANCLDVPGRYRRMTVLLRTDETYAIVEHHPRQFREAMNVFNAALVIYGEKNGNNRIPGSSAA
jgi:hypothetical protein